MLFNKYVYVSMSLLLFLLVGGVVLICWKSLFSVIFPIYLILLFTNVLGVVSEGVSEDSCMILHFWISSLISPCWTLHVLMMGAKNNIWRFPYSWRMDCPTVISFCITGPSICIFVI